MPRSTNLREDLLWGVKWGIIMAFLYTIVALVIYGSAGDEPFRANQVTLVATIAGYLAGGLFAGALLGFLRPWTRRRGGAILVGSIVGVVACAALDTAIDGPPTTWRLANFVGVGFAGIFLGAWGGYYFWQPSDRRTGGDPIAKRRRSPR